MACGAAQLSPVKTTLSTVKTNRQMALAVHFGASIAHLLLLYANQGTAVRSVMGLLEVARLAQRGGGRHTRSLQSLAVQWVEPLNEKYVLDWIIQQAA